MPHVDRLVVVVGTAHSIQLAVSGPNATVGKKLRGYLQRLCNRYSIRAVGEEMSAEALAERRLEASIPMRVAELAEVPHRCCDPGEAERKRLGVLGYTGVELAALHKHLSRSEMEANHRADDEKRERYWAEQLAEWNQWPVLFVCGANHVPYFRVLLETDGINVEIGAEDWQPKSRARVKQRSPKR